MLPLERYVAVDSKWRKLSLEREGKKIAHFSYLWLVERAAEKPVEKSMMFAFVMMCTSSTVPKKQACRKGEIGVATRVAASAVVAASAIWLASSSPCLAVVRWKCSTFCACVLFSCRMDGFG